MVYFLPSMRLQESGLFRLGVGEIGPVLGGDLVQRRLGDIHIALVDEGGGQAVEHGQHQGADLVAVHIGIGTDDDLVEAQVVQIEGGQVLVVLPPSSTPQPMTLMRSVMTSDLKMRA